MYRHCAVTPLSTHQLSYANWSYSRVSDAGEEDRPTDIPPRVGSPPS